MKRSILYLLVPFALAACEQLGIDDPVKVAEKQDAEGRAIGSGCRHVGRSLEDCYVANKKASKAAIFAGWREMDGYMRENKIETVGSTPEGEEETAGGSAKSSEETGGKAAAPAKAEESKAAARGKKTARLGGTAVGLA